MPRFDGTSGPDTIDGSTDPDVIKGYAGDDTLNGNGGDDDIDGGEGNDTIDGGTGADFMAGQGGNDTYYVDDAGDRIAESPGSGNDRVITTVEYAIPNYVESMAILDLRSTNSINLYGNSDANTIYGNDGANVIDGREGIDIMYGYGGDDAYYVDNTLDIVRDFMVGGNDGGNDIIFTTVSYFLSQTTGEYVERLVAFDPTSTDNIILTGNSLDNEIVGNDGHNRLDGREGLDTLYGLGGDDTYTVMGTLNTDIIIEYQDDGFDTVVTSGRSYTLPENVEELRGGNGASGPSVTLRGNSLDNVIRGGDGADYIDGAGGADQIFGGNGNDVYFVDNTGDVVDERNFASGSDFIFTTVDYTLPRDIERMAVSGRSTTQAVNLTGNEFNNELSGNDGANVLDGKLGRDVLFGYGGADIFAFTTVVDGSNADIFVGFEVGIDKVGLDASVFSGLTPGDLPDSAFRASRFAQDADDRILYETRSGDLFFDPDGIGSAPAQYFATVSNGLALSASDFVVIGSLPPPPNPINGTEGPDHLIGTPDRDAIYGLGGDDTIEARGGDDIVDGGAGADLMSGEAGNDTYYVDDAGDRVAESPNAGYDRVFTTVQYVLPSYVEYMQVTDPRSTDAIAVYGNSDSNELRGNDGANVINGREGADIMYGYAGDDAYYVDNSADIIRDFVVSGNDGGNDIVFTTVSYILQPTTGANGGNGAEFVERLVALDPNSTDNLSLTGNALDNEITGNNGNNVLDGREGRDILMGLGGNDTYVIVQSQGDVAIEFANGGFDRISTSGSFVLAENFEWLTSNTAAGQTATLTGNAADNTISGGGGNDIIDGLAGADTMSGFGGNDVYFVDNAGDVVDESTNGGSDFVFTSVNFTLSANIERAAVTDPVSTQAVNLTGNQFANELSGNDGANVLDGKLGLDTLIGYGGADIFAFTTVVQGHNADLFVGFEPGVDKVALDDAVFAGLTPGALPAEAFVIGRFAADADDRILYEASTGDVFFDRDGTGPLEAQYFASMADGLSLTANDFIVI